MSIQETLEVSLPKERSKPFFQKKELSEKAKKWLVLHDETNWEDVILNQDYLKGKILTKIIWKLPGTADKKETCGLWKRKGCFNRDCHPMKKPFVKK